MQDMEQFLCTNGVTRTVSQEPQQHLVEVMIKKDTKVMIRCRHVSCSDSCGMRLMIAEVAAPRNIDKK